MFKRNTETSDQQWKTKYFNSLEELETKEKLWGVLDEAMRKSLSRMSVLIDGVDRQLDKELDYLRLSIRKGADGKKIRAILESVFSTLEKVEARRSKNKRLSSADAYGLLIDRLVLPKGCAKKVKGLKKSISRLGEEDSPSDVIREFEELIRYSFSLIKENSSTAQDKQDSSVAPEKAAAEVAPKPKTPEQKTATQKVAEPAAVQEHTGQIVLQEMLTKLALPEDSNKDIKLVQQRLQSSSQEAELSRLASQLASIINEAVSTDQVEGLLQNEDGLSINEVLLQLLEKIELPAELNEDVLRIQGQLEGEVAQSEWPDLLESISLLIRSMREKANEEKKSLETFLTQLTDQLQTLDNFISGVEKDHQESIHEGQALSDRMQDHIQNIGKTVDDAAELEQLKGAVRTRLQAISTHMTEFRSYEEDRDVRAQEKIDELNKKIRSMEEDSEKLRNKVKQERESAMMDQLTKVHNRLAYDERMEQEYARWKRYQTPLSLIVIDIDLFKKINDNFGHIAGDKVLHTVAQNLEQNIRETDFLARYGGEEFVIIMPDTSAQEGLAVAEKVRAAVEECGFHYRGDSVKVTISCGVGEFSQGDTAGRVFEKADEAMYRAKSEGRNRCFAS